MISPALARYNLTRLHNASFLMLVHAAPLAFSKAVSLPPDDLASPKGQELAELVRRIWGKFASDMSIDQFARMCDQIWHCRNVEALQHYISSMLREVFVQRPQTLRSSDAVKISDVLACQDMSEIVQVFAERKVDGLSYQGFDDLLGYLTTGLGLPLKADEKVLRTVKECIEVRNIVVHNSGLVNRLFIRRTGRTDLVEKQPFPLNQDYVVLSGQMMHALTEALDAAFIEHFSLRFGASPSPVRSGDKGNRTVWGHG